MQDYSLTADNYAYDVVSGQIPAGKYIQLAAQSHLDEKKNAAITITRTLWHDTERPD